MRYINLTKQDLSTEKKLLTSYRQLLSKMPPGRLSVKRIKGRHYYYVVQEEDGKQVYISLKNRQLIYDLKQKRLLQEAVKTLEQNIKDQEKLLLHYRDYDLNQIQKSLPDAYSDANLTAFQEQTAAQAAKNWENGKFNQNPYYPENLIHKTSFGLVVRTKSEALIAELLHSYGIPFRYECELNIPGRDGRIHHYYPDFTILTPQNQYIYWEHLGRLDLTDYAKRSFNKLLDFYDNRIIAPDNLILTMDGPSGTIDIEAIDRIIKGQLLPLFQSDAE